MNDNKCNKEEERLEELGEFIRLKVRRVFGWGITALCVTGHWFILRAYNLELAGHLKYPLTVAIVYCLYRAIKKVKSPK